MELKEAYTYFFVPFFLKEGSQTNLYNPIFTPTANSIWEKARIPNLEENILYPYIQSFIQNSIREEVQKERFCQELLKGKLQTKVSELNVPMEQKLHYYQIYSIKETAQSKCNNCLGYSLCDIKKAVPVNQCKENDNEIDKLKDRLHCWKTLKRLNLFVYDKEEKKQIVFNIPGENRDFNSPKLVIFPLARIGILMFCFRLNSINCTSDALLKLNYLLHKIGGKQDAICTTDISGLQNEISVLIRTLESSASTEEKKNLKKVLNYKQKTLEGICNLFSNNNAEKWTITELIHFLLDNFVCSENPAIDDFVVLFNNTRIHLFTYYQLKNVDLSNPANLDEVRLDLARIIRCQNHKYKLDIEDVNISELYTKSFQNIYFGSSVEGGGIMTILTDEKSDFLQNFHKHSFSKRYIWIYLMVLMQRYTLLYLINELTSVDDDNLNVSLVKLKKEVEHLSAVKVNTYFTDVSDFTQHNLFYRFCMRNLHIPEHFKEIDEKMAVLNAAIRHKEKEKEEIRENRLALILAILAIASASKDGSDLFKDYNVAWGIFIILILSSIVLYVWTNKELHLLNKIKVFFHIQCDKHKYDA